MTEEKSDLMDSARLWMIRANEPDFDNWIALTEWLEEDPDHLEAYETALREDAWVTEMVSAAARPEMPVAAPPPSRTRHPRKRTWLAVGGALAAALTGVATWTVQDRAGEAQQFVTAPGEHRSIALADGTRVELNGDTRISYDPESPRLVTLEHGEAVFEVSHDAANPFVVTVGDTRLIDAGTVFNVVHEAGSLQVSVAEGAVIYDAREQPIRLKPGDALVRLRPSASPELSRVDASGVGSWRDGVLSYDDASFSVIARDLARTVGKPVRVSGEAGDRRYSGTLVVSGPSTEVMARVGSLLGVTFRESGDAWEMMPADGAMH